MPRGSGCHILFTGGPTHDLRLQECGDALAVVSMKNITNKTDDTTELVIKGNCLSAPYWHRFRILHMFGLQIMRPPGLTAHRSVITLTEVLT